MRRRTALLAVLLALLAAPARADTPPADLLGPDWVLIQPGTTPDAPTIYGGPAGAQAAVIVRRFATAAALRDEWGATVSRIDADKRSLMTDPVTDTTPILGCGSALRVSGADPRLAAYTLVAGLCADDERRQLVLVVLSGPYDGRQGPDAAAAIVARVLAADPPEGTPQP